MRSRGQVPVLQLLAAVAIIGGAAGPWLRFRGVDIEAFDTDRTIVSVAGALAAVLVFLAGLRSERPLRLGLAACGLVGLALSAYRVVDVLTASPGTVGWGLWVALAGSVALLVSAARA